MRNSTTKGSTPEQAGNSAARIVPAGNDDEYGNRILVFLRGGPSEH